MTTTGSRTGLPHLLGDVVDTALGEAHREDPTLPRTGGPAGNARLTAWVGLALLALFLVECVTLVSLHQLIGVHIIVGTILVPLALLKTATTGWRILRYYTGDRAYRLAGPPPLLLRLLGPLVILTALAVLGSGLALIPLGSASHDALLVIVGQRIDAVTVHQICFVAWLVVVGVHTLVRLVPSVGLVGGRLTPGVVPGRGLRLAAIAMTLAIGAVGGVVAWHAAADWTGHDDAGFAHSVDGGG